MGCCVGGKPGIGTEVGGDWEEVRDNVWSMRVICSGVKELRSGAEVESVADRGDMSPPAAAGSCT